jgi:hypothetical protein
MSGLKALVGSMHTYTAQSSFIDLIEEEAIIPAELQPLPLSCTETKPPTTDDIEALHDLYPRLQEVRIYVKGHQVEAGFIGKIIDFITMLQLKSPMISPQEQFMASRWLRPAIISLPISIMQRLRREPQAMIAAAYFHVAILIVQPFFPALGAMASFPEKTSLADYANFCSSSAAWRSHRSVKFQGSWKSSGIIRLRDSHMSGPSHRR